MSNTDIAAWWGAIVATVVAIYTIYTRVRDESVRFTVKTFREMHGIGIGEGWISIQISVRNVGKRTTTIDKVQIEDLSSSPPTILSTVDSTNQPLPFALEPGNPWNGVAEHDLTELIVSPLREKARVCVYHAHSDRPVRAKFSPKNEY